MATEVSLIADYRDREVKGQWAGTAQLCSSPNFGLKASDLKNSSTLDCNQASVSITLISVPLLGIVVQYEPFSIVSL
jgi:hypothetical protein